MTWIRNARHPVALGTVFLAVALALACAHHKPVDVVHGIPPMSTAMSSIGGTLAEMATLPPAARGAYLEEHWPHLSEDVTYFLRQQGKIRPRDAVTLVEFKFGSLQRTMAESGAGGRHFGYFNDQLVALVHLQGAREPVAAIVECLNGTFATVEQFAGLQSVGSHHPMERFVIGRREGLVHHVDFPTAISLAERFDLPLYRGRSFASGQRITPAQARAMEPDTDYTQVTVFVVEGDRFDLAAGTFTPSPRRTRTRS